MGFYRCPYILRTGKVCNEGCYRPEGCRVHWNSPTRVPCKECGKLTPSIFGVCRTHAGKNPHQDLQAQDRAHRIGQKNEVKVLRLISQKSIEENILARAQFKLDIDGKVIQAGKFDHKSTAQEQSGDNDETNEVLDNEVLDNDEINEILARSDDEIRIFREIDDEREKNEEKEWLSSGNSNIRKSRLVEEHELPPLYLAEYQEIRSENVEEYGRGQRQRKEVFYDDGLTEDQYLKALEKNLDVTDLITKKKKAYLEKKSKGKEVADDFDLEEEQEDEEQEDGLKVKKHNQRDRKGKRKAEDMESGDEKPKKISSKKYRRKRMEMKISDEDGNEIKGNNSNVASSSNNYSRRLKQKFTDSGSSTTPSSSLFHQCIVHLESFIDNSDEKPRKRAELFLDLPNRREYPSYYKAIKKPVSLNLLRKRINRGHYKSYDEFFNDMILMFDNARTFNEDESEIYQDANILQAFNTKFTQLVSNN
ncbi:5586_t:CDS:2 [Entrophospora sp. SA101]|nr:5586_t:CDS:2 [Entrophospora sp. SA101]